MHRIPTEQDLDNATTIVNNLTIEQRNQLLEALRAYSSPDLRGNDTVFFPFCQGFLLGLMTKP